MVSLNCRTVEDHKAEVEHHRKLLWKGVCAMLAEKMADQPVDTHLEVFQSVRPDHSRRGTQVIVEISMRQPHTRVRTVHSDEPDYAAKSEELLNDILSDS